MILFITLIIIIACCPIPFVIFFDYKRNTLFKKLSKEFSLLVEIKSTPWFLPRSSSELLNLRSLQGTRNNKKILIQDIYKRPLLIAWLDRHLILSISNSIYQFTKFTVDSNEILIDNNEDRTLSGFAKERKIKELLNS